MAKQDTASAFLEAVRGAEAGGTAAAETPEPPAKPSVMQSARQVLKKVAGKAAPKRAVQIDGDIVAYFEKGRTDAAPAIEAVLRAHMKP